MLATQGQSKIAMSNLLLGKVNPIMREINPPSSPQWVHIGLRIHPLPLVDRKRTKNQVFWSLYKFIKVDPEMALKRPSVKKCRALRRLRAMEENLFKKHFKLKKHFY